MEKIPKRFWEDDKWAEEHYSELMKKYAGEWIAVFNKKVISCGKNLAKVKEEAMLKVGKQKIQTLFIESGDHVY